MICPRCGHSASMDSGRCPACGTAVARSAIATGTIAIDTTGLPPGATFGPTGPTVADAATGASASAGATFGATVGETIGGAPAASGTTGPLRVGESFGQRYHVIKVLGVGGMGAVYQTWDAELGVAVALKVIRNDRQRAASSEVEKRFKNELLLARKVTHKNVVRIHDLGEIDGIKYITMPYIQGDDLAKILHKDGRLPVARALRLAKQVASGLEAAHEAGVVHRDLKPPNVMISGQEDPQAMIMDFGISASTTEDLGGGITGTLEYMAPEQATSAQVDGRADIYAFGLIVYEMLTGPRAVEASTARERVDAMKRRFEEGLPPIRTVDATIAEPLAGVVMRCLEKDPAARFQTSTELAAALAALDDQGELVPIPPRFSKGVIATAAATVAGLVTGTWYFTRTPPPPKQHDPVSVVVADFKNSTGDAAFSGSLEPTIRIALESAGFISAFDRTQISKTGAKTTATMDEPAAREIAIRQGLGVVLSGEVARAGTDYRVSVKAIRAVTGEEVTSAQARVNDKTKVLGAATNLTTKVRKALGDDTSDAVQRFAMETLSSPSLEVVQSYATAMEALSNSKFEDARKRFARAVELDPNFGLAYAGMAIASSNLGQQQDAEKYVNEAIRHVDRMTERERFRTRGLFYLLTNDYVNCVKEYNDLITKYAADAAAHNNLALCSTKLRDMPKAVEEMRRVVSILPKRALYRMNVATYAAYSSDFEPVENDARAAIDLGAPWGLQPLAFAQTALGRLSEAADSYRAMGKSEELGPSYEASGLADLALYEGRFADAVRLLESGVAADLAAKDADRAASKLAALGYAHLLRQQKPAAIDAARRALAATKTLTTRFIAARVLVEAADSASALQVAKALSSELQAEPRAYAKILEGDAALKKGDARDAVRLLTESTTLLDTWIGRFDLGRANLGARLFAQADSEFERCLKRRGEALSLFLDEEPTYAYLPAVYYYQGLVREGLKSTGFADAFRAYQTIREKAGEDPLLPDIRRRVAR